MRKYPLSLLKDKNIVTFFDFWGKTRRGEKDGGDDYHLLCWHSLDVAAMGYLMVKRNCFGLADYFRQLGISDKEQAAQFFAWLLCWHDIGKFARSFQQLYLPPELKIQESARKNYEKISHSTLGYWLWNHYLSECQELLPSSSLSPRKLRRVIEMWMPVTTGHHGRPPDRMDELDNFLPEDKAAARDFLLEIKPLFPLIEIPAFWDDDEGIELIKHLSWYISATVVLADWTGSSTRFFPRVAHPMDIKGYWQKTLIQAQNALTVFPLKAKVAPFNGINTLFPFIENPTPLQQKVLDLDISQQGPQLFILEDVTGAGKTEAALILAHRLIAAGKAQGLFFGLPTMATANAMYDRLVKTWLAFYSPESRPSLVLAHSARTLMDRFNESLWSGDLVGSEEPDEQTFSQGCAAWFADSNKKALLAEIGVGTLDQAMMAVMPFKHNNLRLLGLSNKILLADEIHACDAYMSCILEGLIERQARGGNSVILLSATLSQQQRDKLVAAFARGTEGQQEAPFLEKDDYPWLTHVTKSDVNSHRVATRKDVERSVSVGWLHSEQECIARIESAVSQGKCIAWIRNSVDDAIKVHRQLLARGVIPASSLSLFHSRFAFSDRQRIETETLARFGKYCSLQRASQVIVCTQVIEQSVDIDLDEMISDLAPVDLLIQRAGRLQRHIRDINGQLTEYLCPHCSALALFSLQLNAPSGGKGYRTGLRGGGPMTTLIELQEYQGNQQTPLWRKLWINVMPQDEADLPLPKKFDDLVFPWLGPTRTSELAGAVVTDEQVNKLQAYWGMPRRIRIDFNTTTVGNCDICGEQSDALLSLMTTKNYGANYAMWQHPLTPYRIPLKEGGEFYSVKPQPGGLIWRDWLGLIETGKSENNTELPALVVKLFNASSLKQAKVGLWGFGYDFDNMKARCWYEHHFPLPLVPGERRPAQSSPPPAAANRIYPYPLGAGILPGWRRR